MLQKRVLLAIDDKVKIRNFDVTTAKRVAVFQASLKVVREEARAQLSNKDNKHSVSQGANCLHEGGML